jgi:hypothetical protein
MYEISTEEILRQAQFLADLAEETKCMYTMSIQVRKSYKFAFKQRRRYAVRYANNRQADDGHAYFLAMMEKVQHLLKDFIEVQKLSRTAHKSVKRKEKATDSSQIVYEALGDIVNENDDDGEEDLPDDPSDTAASNEASVVYIPVVFRLEEDLKTRWHLFLSGYVPLLEFLAENWAKTEYPDVHPYIKHHNDQTPNDDALNNESLSSQDLLDNHDLGEGASSYDPAVCTAITEVAVALFGDQEEKIYRARDALTSRTGKTYMLIFGTKLEDLGFQNTLMLRDVTAIRKKHGQAYPIGLRPLRMRYPTYDISDEDEQYYAALGRVLMNLSLENVRLSM